MKIEKANGKDSGCLWQVRRSKDIRFKPALDDWSGAGTREILQYPSFSTITAKVARERRVSSSVCDCLQPAAPHRRQNKSFISRSEDGSSITLRRDEPVQPELLHEEREEEGRAARLQPRTPPVSLSSDKGAAAVAVTVAAAVALSDSAPFRVHMLRSP